MPRYELRAVVTEEKRHAYKLACLLLFTTMADDIRERVDETIARAEAVRKEWAKDE